MKKFIISVSIFFITGLAVAADTNYFVSQSGTGSRNGSESNKWSVSDFNSSGNWSATDDSAKIDPGDTVYFSGTITSTIVVPNQKSGTAGNYITLDGYYNGNCTPTVTDTACSGGALVDPNTFCSGCSKSTLGDGSGNGIHVYGSDYLIIQDFSIQDCGGTALFIQPDDPSGNRNISHHIVVRRNWLNHNENTNFNCWDCSYVTVGGSSTDGNVFKNADYSFDVGPDDGQWNSGLAAGWDNVVISYNRVFTDDPYLLTSDSISGNSFEINAGSKAIIEYNEFAYSPDETGLSLKEFGTHDVVVRFNYFHHADEDESDNQSEGTGVSSGTEGTHHYIYANYSTLNSYGTRFQRSVENSYAWSNVFAENKKMGAWSITNGASYSPPRNVYFYNNTVVGNARRVRDDSTYQMDDQGFRVINAGGDFKIKNNIFVNNRDNKDNLQWEVESGGVVADFQHNLYWYTGANESSTMVRWVGSNRSIAYIKANSPYNENESPAGSVGDPSFTTVGTNVYALGGSSPALGTGADLSVPGAKTITIEDGLGNSQDYNMAQELNKGLDPNNTDFFGWPIQVGLFDRDTNDWDRGAYAFVTSGDTTAPVLSGASPSSNITCTTDPRDVVLQIWAEDAVGVTACKACEDGVGGCSTATDIDVMTINMPNSLANYYSATIEDKGCNQTITYNIKCEDAADNESDATQTTFTIIPYPSDIVGGGSGTISGDGSGTITGD